MRYTIYKLLLLVLFGVFLSSASIAEQNGNNAANSDTKRIYFQRVNYGSSDDVKILLNKGADVNWKNKQDQNGLELALVRDDEETLKIIEILLRNGADPNISIEGGDYPLHQAIQFGNVQAAKLLIDAGANVYAENSSGETPVFLVEYYNRPEIKVFVDKKINEIKEQDRLKSSKVQMQRIMEFYFKNCAINYITIYKNSRKGQKDERTFDRISASINDDIDSLVSYFATYHNDYVTPEVLSSFAKDASVVVDRILAGKYPRLSSPADLAPYGTSDDLNSICRYATYKFNNRLKKAQEDR